MTVPFRVVLSRPEPEPPAGPDEPVDISEPTGPPNRPKPESRKTSPSPITEPLERV
jgi:hypothetical protein